MNITFDPDGKWLNLSITVKNNGRSNAWNIQTFTAERRSKVFPQRFSGHAVSSFIVNAGIRAKTGMARLRQPNKYPVWLFGYLSYTTVYEATFKSFFCCRLDGVPHEDAYGDTVNSPIDARGEVDLPSNT